MFNDGVSSQWVTVCSLRCSTDVQARETSGNTSVVCVTTNCPHFGQPSVSAIWSDLRFLKTVCFSWIQLFTWKKSMDFERPYFILSRSLRTGRAGPLHAHAAHSLSIGCSTKPWQLHVCVGGWAGSALGVGSQVPFTCCLQRGFLWLGVCSVSLCHLFPYDYLFHFLWLPWDDGMLLGIANKISFPSPKLLCRWVIL